MGAKTFNRSLQLLCGQPSIIGKPVVAVSASGYDQLKVSVARFTRDKKYTEVKTKVFDDAVQAIYYARLLAKAINTYEVYEVRVFRNDEVEFIRIIDDPNEKWLEPKELQGEMAEIKHIYYEWFPTE